MLALKSSTLDTSLMLKIEIMLLMVIPSTRMLCTENHLEPMFLSIGQFSQEIIKQLDEDESNFI